MLCDLCNGHKDPEENRFCGMCGMPLESAIFKATRRTLQAGRAQNTTPEKVPGWTGTTEPEPSYEELERQISDVLRKTSEGNAVSLDDLADAIRRTIVHLESRIASTGGLPHDDSVASSSPEAERDSGGQEPAAIPDRARSQHERSTRHSASASFLGLNDSPEEPPQNSVRPGQFGGLGGPSFLGLDRGEASGSYLLQDEGRRHWRGYLLMFTIIALAILSGLKWRAELHRHAQRVGASVQTQTTQTRTQEPARSAENIPEAATTVPTDTPAAPAGTHARPSAPPATPTQNSASTANGGSAPPTADDSATETSDASEATAKLEAQQVQQPHSHPGKRNDGREGPRSQTSKLTSRPPAESTNNTMLVKAQKYLHVRDCQQGMIYLRQAVRHPDAAALSQMGALYATGMCVQQNRVEAYEWFTSALNMDPSNRWLARERQILYGEMTMTERRQIGR